MTDHSTGVVQAVGYTLVLPPGWAEIPLRCGTSATVRKILDDAFSKLRADIPRDKLTPYRQELERRLKQLISQARSNGGICLYLPVEHMHQAPIAASFVISQQPIGPADGVETAEILAQFATRQPSAEIVAVADGMAGRIEHSAPAEPGTETEHGSRRVDYVIPVPGQGGEWLVIAFSTLGGGNPDDGYAKLLVELFDAIVATFRWTTT